MFTRFKLISCNFYVRIMRLCKYPSCNHSSKNNSDTKCSLHQFPISREKCLMWLNACGFKKTPSKVPNSYYLCSCHFKDFKPTKDNPLPTAVEEVEGEESVENVSMKDSSEDLQLPRAPDKKLVSILKKGRGITTHSNEEVQEHEAMELSPNLSSQFVTFEEDPVSSDEWSSCDLSSVESNEVVIIHSDDSASDKCESDDMFAISNTIDERNMRGDGDIDSLADTLELLRTSSSEDNLKEGDDVQDDFDLAMPFSPIISSFEGFGDLPDSPGSKGKHPSDEKASPSKRFKEGNIEVNSPPIHEAAGQGRQVPRKQPRKRRLYNTPPGAMVDKIFRDTGVQCIRPPFSYDSCRLRTTPKDFKHQTGISDTAFEILFQFLGGEKILTHLKYHFAANTPKRDLESEHTPRDRLFITLVRLRRGLALRDLKLAFHLSEATLSTIFYTWIRVMAIKFEQLEKDIFVKSSVQAVNPPDCYKPFPNLRCVIDCTEFKIQRPKNMSIANNTYSDYKGANTLKVQVATSVFGGLCHISRAAEGSISDRALFLQSGLLDFVQAGEAIMSDKGFDVEAELNNLGIHLLVPQYLGQRDKFTAREMLINKALATSRVHVERFIKYIKDFKLIRYQIPNTLVDLSSDIIKVCANLVMFSEPFIQWHPQDDSDQN